MAARLSDSLAVRFAAMVHDLGKGTTDKKYWPSHHDHEKRGLKLIAAVCDRLAVPNRCRDLALHVARYHTVCHRAAELQPDTILRMFEATDAFRRQERFDELLITCEADARGRTGLEEKAYPEADILRAALTAACNIDKTAIHESGVSGPAFGDALRATRLSAIESMLTKIRHTD
jgi:tRNA nucleotidyltransferase (CCA-adding enzyme)